MASGNTAKTNPFKKAAEQNNVVTQTAEEDQGEVSATEEESVPETVTAIIPKDFKLRLDHHTVKDFKAGTVTMLKSDALHPWSVANGVKIFTPTLPE